VIVQNICYFDILDIEMTNLLHLAFRK